MSVAERLLEHCEKVRRTGPGSWLACCPAHDDRNPSMTVRETNDGMVLVHCFGGCSFEDIIGAVGIAADELFPEKLPERDMGKPTRFRFPAADVFLIVQREMDIVQLVADDIVAGRFKPEDAERVRTARNRIREAIKQSGVLQSTWRPDFGKR